MEFVRIRPDHVMDSTATTYIGFEPKFTDEELKLINKADRVIVSDNYQNIDEIQGDILNLVTCTRDWLHNHNYGPDDIAYADLKIETCQVVLSLEVE